MEEFKRLIAEFDGFKRLNKQGQSYLFCSFDPLSRLLGALTFIERDAPIKFDDSLTSPSPDITILPQKVTVADINNLTLNAATTPLSLQHKYYIIGAEGTNEVCFNKLLKTLEEPPPHLKIFVLANNRRSVPATILSRCQVLMLDSLNLDSIGKNTDQFANEIHLNSIFRLINAQKGAYNEPFEIAMNTLLYMQKSSQMLPFVQKFTQSREKLADIIDMCELILHDCMLLKARCDIRLKSHRADLVKIADFYGLNALIRLKNSFLTAKKRINGFGNINSIADEFLFSLLEIRQKYNS